MMSKPRTTLTLSFALAASCGLGLLAAPSPAVASSPQECAPSYDMDPLRLLRQSSLDLLGRPPTIEEIEAVRASNDRQAAVEDAIDGMLGTEDYLGVIRDYHRNLLWGSLAAEIARVFPGTRQVRTVNLGGGVTVYAQSSLGLKQRYRGRNDLFCVNQEQPDDMYDVDGRPLSLSTFQDVSCAGGTCGQEGWVRVNPYWDPNSEIQVCARDAQDFEVGTQGQQCSDVRVIDAGCGCGDDLRHCSTTATREVIRAALAEEPARIFEWFVRNEENYLQAFESDLTMMNGPVAHYYKWMRADGTASTSDISFEADMGEGLVANYTNEAWGPVQRGPAHAGAFTTVGYQMRFASARARANRFYTAFYCDPFVPSVDGLPPEELTPSPNLRERNGCDGCHQVLEPAAAHFARWRTNSAFGYLDDALVDIDTPNEDCMCGAGTGTNCTAFCSKYFVTADNSEPETYALYGGLPLTSAYASPTELQNTNLGPAALVDEAIEQYTVGQCAVRTMAEHLLHRSLESTELDWLEEHTQAFINSGYNFTEMVAGLVSDDRYRQIH